MLKDLETTMDYSFQNQSLLLEAMTHKSTCEDRDNERLEFLGDSVIGLIVTESLYRNNPAKDEGELTQKKAWLVSRQKLFEVAEKIQLQNFLRIGKNESFAVVSFRERVLASAFEALIGALFLDGGFAVASKILGGWISQELSDTENVALDYKSELQEYFQKKLKKTPTYQLTEALGPSHNPLFKVEVRLDEQVLGRGQGSSKKRAEQEAALEALKINRAEPQEEGDTL